MTPSKKLFVAGAILATGFSLALLFAAPEAVHLSPIVAAEDAQLANAAIITQSLAGPATREATQLLPEAPPASEQIPANAAGTLPAAPTDAAPPPVEPQMLARLVGIRPTAAPELADARGAMVPLPQVTVQVASAKPVYAAVEYPHIVSAVGSRDPERPTGDALTQASFDAPADAWSQPVSPQRTHVIVDGDSLPRLAERYLDDSARSEEIFQLNEGLLTDPELLPIGLELKIPPRALQPAATTAWDSPQDASAPERGLVPVYDIPSQGTPPPRAQLMRPLPASWPEPQPDE